MNSAIIVGSLVTLSARFSEAGTLFNPNTVNLLVRDPIGAITTHAPDNPSLGVFTYDYLVLLPGFYYYSFRSVTSGEEGVGEGRFEVFASSV